MRQLLAAFLIWLPLAASGQTETAAEAREAARALEAASARLEEAGTARDRVRALTETIQAFESGLAAMRAGLREAAISETQLTQKLTAREGEVAQLIGVLQSIDVEGSPVPLLHPAGPAGAARAGMLLAELTPVLNQRADLLRRDLREVQELRALQTEAAGQLARGLQELQEARTALNQAMANRTDLPTRFTEDPVRTAILIASTETLEGFASGLSEITAETNEPIGSSLGGQIGSLPLPVQGLLLRRANEADAAGVRRPGVILATRPGAIVTSPSAATVRYQGPLLDLGNVVILEPQADTLFVLAGLDIVYPKTGEVIGAGTPLGLMGGQNAEIGGELSPLREGTGTDRTETLYIEVRKNNTPEDPAEWFLMDEDR